MCRKRTHENSTHIKYLWRLLMYRYHLYLERFTTDKRWRILLIPCSEESCSTLHHACNTRCLQRMWVDFWDRYMIIKIGENLAHDCKQYSAPQANILGFKSVISVGKRCKTAEMFAYNFHKFISESKDTKESRSDSLVSEYSYKWVEKITIKNDDDSLVSEYPCKWDSTVL